MTDLLQIFTGNPLSTFVGKKIEAATKPELESEDWALNMEICDIINENDDDAKDAARAIKKRLQQIEQDKDFVMTNRTLTLMDTCVSNCSHRFHILVMTKDFIQDLVKLIGPKNNPPIELQERVLGLIERWADAFMNQPDLSGVVSVYNELKTKGVPFPPKDPNTHVPIQTPQRSIPSPTQPQSMQQMMSRPGRDGTNPALMMPSLQQPPVQVSLEGEGYNKITQDLVVVQSSIDMYTDMLTVLDSPANDDADWSLADEMNLTCRQMKSRIVDLIERVANEDLTVELLRLNDELNSIFNKYERLVENRVKNISANNQQVKVEQSVVTQSKQSTDAPSSGPKLPGVSSRTLNELSLIDFNVATSVGETSSRKQQHQPSTTIQSQSKGTSDPTSTHKDPFDTSNIQTNPVPPLAFGLSQLDIGSTKGLSELSKVINKPTKVESKEKQLPEEISSVREQDFAEIENWLSTDSGRDLASISGDLPSIEPMSIPNSEFDNFIASRALAGSSSSNQQQKPKEPQEKKPEPSV